MKNCLCVFRMPSAHAYSTSSPTPGKMMRVNLTAIAMTGGSSPAAVMLRMSGAAKTPITTRQRRMSARRERTARPGPDRRLGPGGGDVEDERRGEDADHDDADDDEREK